MKTSKKIKGKSTGIMVCLVALILSINSCRKLIDVAQPINTLTTASLFTNDAQANSAIAGIYSQMMTNTGSLVMSNGGLSLVGGLSSDELVSYQGALNAGYYQFETNKLQTSNNLLPLSLIWQPAYHVIYTANAAMEGAASSTSATLTTKFRNELKGECEFVRAFNFFYLTNLFGDIPLTLTSDFTQTAHLPRASQADVYRQIIKDLLDAQALLPGDYSAAGGERIRANKWAATALLARVYLYQKDWKNAEVQASAVIADSQFGLVAPLDSVFNKNSREAILQFQPNIGAFVNEISLFDTKNFVPQNPFSTSFDPDFKQVLLNNPDLYKLLVNKTSYPSYYLTKQLASIFEVNDQRRGAWLDSLPSPQAAPYFGLTTYFSNKYKSPVRNQYFMVLRLAEQYLIRAEARAHLGKLSDAASDLSAIRARAGLLNSTASSQTGLLDAIATERRVELFTEFGHRWLDLKRTGKASSVLGAITAKQAWNDTQLLYPIPPIEIKNDPGLTQNPGYDY